MFQYYKKLLFSNIAFYAMEQDGWHTLIAETDAKNASGAKKGSEGPQKRYNAFNNAKLEEVKIELAKLGNTTNIKQLEQAVEGIHGDTRTEVGKLLLDTVVKNFLKAHPHMTQ
jgi:hypothetical protein